MRQTVQAAIAACLVLIQPACADDRFATAEALLQAGAVPQTLQLATALATENPESPKAFILLGRAQIAAAQPQHARKSAARAWQTARGNSALRFDAARLAARSASDAGRYGAARLWLRRASDYADDAPSRAVIAQSFAALRKVDPSSTRLSFSVTPSSNINAGTSEDRLVVDGIETPLFFSGDARALSGIAYGADVDHRQRISKGAGTETWAGFRFSGLAQVLSDTAKRQAPDRASNDFSSALIEVSLEQRHFAQTAETRYGVTLSRLWQGGNPESSRLRFNARTSHVMSPAVIGDVGLVVEGRQLDRDQTRSAAVSVIGGLQWKTGRQIVTGRLALTRVQAPDRPSETYSSASGSLLFAPQLQNTMIEPKIELSAAVSTFDTVLGNVFGNDGRTDQRLAVELTLDLPKMARMGIFPSLSVSAARTWSNVSRYDVQEVSASFGLKSTF